MKKSIYVLAVTLVIATLVISSTASISIINNSTKIDDNISVYESTVAPKNDDSFIQRLMRLLTGEIIDVDISDSANINPSKIDENVISDIVVVWNETQSQYLIPTDYYVVDTGILKIEYLSNLVAKLGGMSKTLIETNVKRLVVRVEAYAESSMGTFNGPCWTAPGTLSEEEGKARWELEFKNSDGSSYGTSDWKLLIVTTYLK